MSIKKHKNALRFAVVAAIIALAAILVYAPNALPANGVPPNAPFWSKCGELKSIGGKTVLQCTGVLVEKFQLVAVSGAEGSLVSWTVSCSKGSKLYSDGPFLAEPGYDRLPAKGISYPRMTSGDVCSYTFIAEGAQKIKFAPLYDDELHLLY